MVSDLDGGDDGDRVGCNDGWVVCWAVRMAAPRDYQLGLLTDETMVATTVATWVDLKVVLSVAGMVLKSVGVMADLSGVMMVGKMAVQLLGSWGRLDG